MKRTISMLLALVMVLSLVPISAFAADLPMVSIEADKTEVKKGETVLYFSLEQLPIDPVLSMEADAGKIEFNEGTQMESILGVLDDLGLKAE